MRSLCVCVCLGKRAFGVCVRVGVGEWVAL